MKRLLSIVFAILIALSAFAQEEKIDSIPEISVVSFYRNDINISSLKESSDIIKTNYGQEPSHMFKRYPSIIALSDNGTEFGYGYYRIRGLDQTRINVTLDGMPWNEAEDFGAYFANSPDLMSSMHSTKVERGASALSNGVCASAGSISLESVDLIKDTLKYAAASIGSYNTHKVSAVYNSGKVGNYAMHLKVTDQATDGFRDWSFNDSQALTMKVGRFFGKSSIDFLTMNGQHKNGQGWIGNTAEELAANPRANGCSSNDTDFWRQSVNKLQYKGWLNDMTVFTASMYLQYQTGDYRMDLDNYMKRMEDSGWANTNAVYDYGLTHWLYGMNAVAKTYFSNISLAYGFNMYEFERKHFMDNSLNIENVSADEFYNNTGKKGDMSAFLTASMNLSKLTLKANVQYRYADFWFKDNLTEILYEKLASWNFLNFGATAEYEFDKASEIYVRYAMTHREPTRSDMFGGNEWYVGELTTTEAEKVNDIEIGWAYSENKLSANVNGYLMLFDNERVLNGEYGLNGLPMHESIDDSYRVGVEMSTVWKFAKSFIASTNVSWSKNQIKIANGWKQHILTPNFTADADVCYDDGVKCIGLLVNGHSKMYVDQMNEYALPYYMTLNAYCKYNFGKVELELKANNIFNRNNFCTGAVGAEGAMLYFRDAGTNILADIKFYF